MTLVIASLIILALALAIGVWLVVRAQADREIAIVRSDLAAELAATRARLEAELAAERKAGAEKLTVLKDAEGATVTLPAGFDAGRIHVTGNVAGKPPFRGALKHHGWFASAVRLPSVSENLDARVLMPAEVEL